MQTIIMLLCALSLQDHVKLGPLHFCTGTKKYLQPALILWSGTEFRNEDKVVNKTSLIRSGRIHAAQTRIR